MVSPEAVEPRVAHVITGLTTGGAQMMLFKLLSYRSAGAQVAVISLVPGGTVSERLQSAGVSVETLGMSRGVPSMAALRRLSAILRRIRPDVIQGWMYHANLAASLARIVLRPRPPVIWGVRQSLYDLRKEPALTRLVIRANAWLCRQADVILYNSQTSARQHEAFGFDAALTRVIPNGFDTDVFRPNPEARARLRQEWRLHDDDLVIGLIGRYHPMKDHLTFLDAAAMLLQDAPGVRFVLAGPDVSPDNAELTARVQERGLANSVHLLGDRRDTPEVNAALDIASSSSAWGEGFANVIGEAMSCAVPCVVTDVGDSAWIVGDTGMLVSPRHPAELAMAWQRMIALGRDGQTSMGARARQRVIDYFSLGVVATQYAELYQQVVARSER